MPTSEHGPALSIKPPLWFTPPVRSYLFPTISSLSENTLMLTFNMLFTHKEKTVYSARRIASEGKTNGPPLPSAPLYLSLTIWIANRTIYHRAIHLFYVMKPGLSFRDLALYGNAGLYNETSTTHFV